MVLNKNKKQNNKQEGNRILIIVNKSTHKLFNKTTLSKNKKTKTEQNRKSPPPLIQPT